MALALQWHTQSNRSDSIVQATPRANFDPTDGDVVIVICDGKVGQEDDPRLAAAAAQLIYESFQRDTAAETTQRLGNALNRAIQLSRANRLDVPGSSNRGGDLRIIAVALQQDKLTIARSKGGFVYLLRGGLLQNLTDDTFSDDADVDIGQLDLEGDDRVMLCNTAVGEHLNDLQVRNVLRGTPSTRKATQALLNAAGADTLAEPLAVATLDYITGTALGDGMRPEGAPAGAGLNSAPSRVSIPAIVALAALLLAGAILIPLLTGGDRQQALGAGTPGTGAGVAATSTPVVIIVIATPSPMPTAVVMPSETPQALPEPVASPVLPTETVAPSPTVEPTPEPTVTDIVLPTLEPTATASRVPTRRPRTPTPVPTEIPATETPLPEPTLAPANTAVPPSNGGGGGGGSQPPPPPPPPPVCPPGATCG